MWRNKLTVAALFLPRFALPTFFEHDKKLKPTLMYYSSLHKTARRFQSFRAMGRLLGAIMGDVVRRKFIALRVEKLN